MATQLDAGVEVAALALASDANGTRLSFPNARLHNVAGVSGATRYGIVDAEFDRLEGRLDTLRWNADGGDLAGAYVRSDSGSYALEAERIQLPKGVRLVRGEKGVEIHADQVVFHALRLTVKGPFGSSSTPAPDAPPRAPTYRQERLRFLDSLSGTIGLTIKVALDLPVLGLRTLDQQLRVPIQEGSLDFRALEAGLDWLEGRFLDVAHQGSRLTLQWKVPIVGAPHELVNWTLDHDAQTLASFGRVPVRTLADYAVVRGPPAKSDDKARRKIVRAFALDGLDVALSLIAPRHFEVGGGVILFGGEDQPGMVDLHVTGRLHDTGPGAIRGKVGRLDTTISDLQVGPINLSADRLQFDRLDELEVTFDGFRPTALTMLVHQVDATNLRLKIGR